MSHNQQITTTQKSVILNQMGHDQTLMLTSVRLDPHVGNHFSSVYQDKNIKNHISVHFELLSVVFFKFFR